MKIPEFFRNRKIRPGVSTSKAFSYYLVYLIASNTHILSIWLSRKISVFPAGDTWMSILSSCAQIIAGLYGITLAGFTFFLSRIDALMISDATVDYIVGSIKTRFKYLIGYITFNVLMTLLISMVLMYLPVPAPEDTTFWYRFFCNEFLLFMATSICLILYYSLLVVNPSCIEKEAGKLKKRMDGRFTQPGNAMGFINLYDQIEQHCNRLIPPNVLHQLHENKGRFFELTLELLEEQKLLPKKLLQDIMQIHRYYECTVNCSPMRVSQRMCTLAEQTLHTLRKIHDPNSEV